MTSEFARARISFALADFTTTCAKGVSFRLRTNAVGSFIVFLSFFSPMGICGFLVCSFGCIEAAGWREANCRTILCEEDF
ncbi:hypothetical protein GCM10010106_51130 [Thermopolyspora flexuosa]|nr:hypothetical protein GCM10010106_51130 [Thermopolyspora flexuosa]